MRDIRTDLRERLEAMAGQRAELEARERRLRALLRDEEASHIRQLPLGSTEATSVARLREFVLGSLKDGHDWRLEDLKEQAHGLGLTTVGATGRSLNIILVNLLREGLVTRLPDGRWRLRDRGTQLALDLTSSSENPDPPDGEAQLAS